MVSKQASDVTLPELEKPVSGRTTPDHPLNMESEKNHHIQHTSEGPLSPAAVTSADQAEYPSGRNLVFIFVSLVMVVFLVSLDMTIVGTAIPKITDEFNGLNDVSWYGTAYFMTFGGFQSAAGKFFKYFPLKPAFIGSIIIFELGSLISAVAKDSTTFIVGRAIAGVGGAGAATGAFSIVAFSAKPHLRPGLMGLIGAIYGLSSVVGPILGGVFSDRVTWRWCFYINLPIGGISCVLMFLFFKTPVQARVVPATWREKFLQMDPIGLILVIGGIISFNLALQYAGLSHPWKSSLVIGLLLGAVAIWVVFIAWEIYQDERAVIPPRLFKQRTVWQPALFQFFFATGYFILLYYLPIYFQSVDGATPIHSGVLNLPLVIAIALGTTISGAAVSKTGHAAPWMMFSAILTTVACGLIYTFDIGTSSGKWIGYQAFYGLVIGAGFMMAMNIAQANAKPEDITSITAIIFLFQVIGGAFALAGAQSAFANRLLQSLKENAPGVDPSVVLATGATQIRTAFPADQTQGIIIAYMAGVKVTFILIVAISGFSVIVAAFVPWKRINMESLKSAGGGMA